MEILKTILGLATLAVLIITMVISMRSAPPDPQSDIYSESKRKGHRNGER